MSFVNTMDRAPAAVGRSLRLPVAASSARLAREFVMSVTKAPEDPRMAVIVTELVTNAVVHAHSHPDLTVTVSGDMVLIEVADDHPGRPRLQPMDMAGTSGRGLAIVDNMAEAWGVRDRTGAAGKVVWARVRLDPPPT
jgi:anti-sigma regulatory factor (Ser/Thr protein kinase)